VLIDVGFHRGEWTSEAAKRYPNARIYCFDPWPRARAFFDEADLPRTVEFFDLALSDSEGREHFYDYDSACNSLALRYLEPGQLVGSYEVNVMTLDEWCARNEVKYIDFLKVDVEGYDLAVLEGSHRLLQAEAIQAFSFEYASGWIASRRFLGEADLYIREHGYSLFKLFPEFLAPFTYRTDFETFHGAMFVGLSRTAVEQGLFPIRHVLD
jgi:FkbM family methyltransferase